MAIQLPNYLSMQNGGTFKSVYVKIVVVMADNQDKTVMADYSVFVDSAAASAGLSPIGFGRISFAFDPAFTSDIVAQAYAQIKLLPEFSTAINV